MKFKLLRLFLCVLLGVLSGFDSAANSRSLKNWLEQSEWKDFVKVIAVYQKQNPGVYLPLEWVPLSDLNFEELRLIVGDAVQKRKKLNNSDLESIKILSLKTNESLRKLIAKAKVAPASENILLSVLKPEQRIALTPLDEVFKKSELGQKIARDLALYPQYEVQKVQVDSGNKKLIYWARKRSDYYNEFFDAPLEAFYSVEVLTPNENVKENIVIKGRFLDKSKTQVSDLKYQRSQFKGSLFGGGADKDLLMGPMPDARQVFVDETGVTHFSGDGHKH